ncbi:unnamed protein product [Larinioides sclopetarius]|uniref:Uncharacterized protein n=1 Tax=Larinioides sclopetarius TaxID=280406 RepID=A0AAV2BJ51_9ARAC
MHPKKNLSRGEMRSAKRRLVSNNCVLCFSSHPPRALRRTPGHFVAVGRRREVFSNGHRRIHRSEKLQSDDLVDPPLPDELYPKRPIRSLWIGSKT